LVGVTRKTVNTIENQVFRASTILALKPHGRSPMPVEELFSISTADLADLADQVALRFRDIGKVHAPTGGTCP